MLWRYPTVIVGCAIFGGLGCQGARDVPVESPKPGFTLWQLPPQTHTQMNSYVLRTVGGKVAVIDGGVAGDAPYLRAFLAAMGNRVDAWFVSHPHPDHVDALTAILTDPRDLRIAAIHGSLPDETWVAEHEPAYLKTVREFHEALRASGARYREVAVGQRIEFDGIRIEILGVRNPEITANAINNSSVVMRVSDETKSILFTGDLGVEGGRKLLDGPYGDRLRADYVQMAHHGQNGVDEPFYRAVRPQACLWPTPIWLWNNDAGEGHGTGPWKTAEVRDWMNALHVRKHFVAAAGLVRIDQASLTTPPPTSYKAHVGNGFRPREGSLP